MVIAFLFSTQILTSVLQRCHTVVLMLLATILKVHTNVDAIKDFLETERNAKVKHLRWSNCVKGFHVV